MVYVSQLVLEVIEEMQQPSLPEVLEYSRQFAHLRSKYREIATRNYNQVHALVTYLIARNKIIGLKSFDGGYSRRYSTFQTDTRFDQIVEPLPKIIEHHNQELWIQINSIDYTLSLKDSENKETKFVGGRELNVLRFQNRFFIVLDNVLLGTVCQKGKKWIIRLPKNMPNNSTEYCWVLTKLNSIGKKADILGVKGRRTVCGT